MQSTCHKVPILASLLTSYKNLKKSFFVSLNVAFFNWKSMMIIILTLHGYCYYYVRWNPRHLGQGQACRKCSINGNYKMTMAVMMMKRMLTCDGHSYKDYFILQWFLLFLDVELSYSPFTSLLTDCFLSFSPKCHHSEKLAKAFLPQGRLPWIQLIWMPPSTLHIYHSKM